MRILLVQPECQRDKFGFRLAAMPEPLALEMLAAAVPDHECRVLDMRLDADLQTVLDDFAPEMVCVTALTPEVYAAQDVLRVAKAHDPGVFTVVGGHHASLLPGDFTIAAVDAIVLGEGERPFAALVAAVSEGGDTSQILGIIHQLPSGQWAWNKPGDHSLDLDAMPLPRRDLVARYRNEYFFLFDKPDTSVVTSRGCPYRCNFCSVWEFYGGRTRQMSPQRVLREVRAVKTDHITFVDDNFMMNHRRENEIADLIKAEGIRKRYSMECRTDSIVRHPELVEKWAALGLYAVLLGLEGLDGTLANVNKKNSLKVNDEAIRILQANGVIIWGAFIANPDWQVDDFVRLKDYVQQKQITHTQYTVLTPLPGTQLYRDRSSDLLTDNYTCFDTLHAVVPTRLPREEFYRQYAGLYRQTSVAPYVDMVRTGKLSLDDCRRGQAMLAAMSDWRGYLNNDPVLGDTVAQGVR